MDVGIRLREAREARGLSIARLSAITRLAPRWLETIERNDPTVFPPGPYARAYVRSYAREVGLDPDEITREYFAQFQAPQDAPPVETSAAPRTPPLEAHPPRPWVVPAVAVLCVGFAVFASRGWRHDAPPAPEGGAVGTSGQLAAAVASTPAPPSAPAPPAAGGLTITLAADEPAWITATADGKRVLYRLLGPGAVETLHGDRQVTIRVGNAGAVRWTIGGRDAGRMGSSGAVRTISVTPENAATVR